MVMRKTDGAMVTGEKVREVLNIPKTKTVTKFQLDLVSNIREIFRQVKTTISHVQLSINSKLSC